MIRDPYVSRVMLKPESGQGDPGGYVLVGSSSDLRTVLEDLLAAVARFENRTNDPTPHFHAVAVGDASSRYDHTYLGIHVDSDLSRHRRKTRRLWRFYDSLLAGFVALIVILLAIVGAGTVWEWLFGRAAAVL